MFTPKAFSIRSAISGDTAALPLTTSDSVARAHAEGLGGLADGKAKLTENFLSDEDAGVGRPHSYRGERLGHQ
jgi:hypothetical protein